MDNKLIGNEKNILFYNDEEGNTKVEVLLENEDVLIKFISDMPFLMLKDRQLQNI